MPGVVIIGGGISGLSAAYYLKKRGIGSTILEGRPHLGGVIQTELINGCVVEAGPDSFLSAKPAAMDLIRELGLESEVIGSNDHSRKTYIWKSGRLRPLPAGLMMMVPTKLMPLVRTPLLSLKTKVRMGWELAHPPKPPVGDQSVAEFIEQHYGREAVDYLAEPLLSGIYGGDPRELSVASVLPRFVDLAKRYGSLTRGVLAERSKAAAASQKAAPLFRTLKGGLGQLIRALETSLQSTAELRQGRAIAVERTTDGFRVRTNGDWIEAAQLLLACEAHNAAPLVRALDPRLGELLACVPYSSAVTVSMGFDSRAFSRQPEGHGFLVPKKERRRLMACTWVGMKFPHRVPEGKVVARCFLGGSEDSGVLKESDQTIAAIVMEEMREIAGLRGEPLFIRIFRWPQSMALYTVGHAQRLAEIQARVAAISGLQLAGNAYDGIGIPDCIRLGKCAAEKVQAPAYRDAV